ncbi:MAG: hypothetical protein H6707_13445 [Deltaproteobacteria bacterium]|nr:hypothetical protein [Deltaproteobacteria bacterium]
MLSAVGRRCWLVACVGLCGVVACNNDSTTPQGDGHVGSDFVLRQDIIQKNPPISDCDKPGVIASCDNRTLCYGCVPPAGQAPRAACHPITQDCREFCNGCIADGYISCSSNAPPTILSLCGHCFFFDGGVQPPECNRLGNNDAGPAADTR